MPNSVSLVRPRRQEGAVTEMDYSAKGNPTKHASVREFDLCSAIGGCLAEIGAITSPQLRARSGSGWGGGNGVLAVLLWPAQLLICLVGISREAQRAH